jgi:GAF domain-containing protein
MWAWLRRILAPPVFEDDEDKTRVARLLNLVLLAMLGVAALIGLALLVTEDPWTGLLSLGILALLVFVALALLRLGRVQVAAVLFSFTLWAFDTAIILVSGGTNSPLTTVYVTAIIVTGLLLGGRAAIVLAGLSIATGVGMFLAQWRVVSIPVLLPVGPETGLLSLTGNAVLAAAFLYVATRSINEALQRTRSTAVELEERQGQLTDLVRARTDELARRTSYRGATTAVANEAARVHDDPQQLLARAASVIGEQSGFYHVGVFLLDQAREWAVLQAASSSGGQRMLDRGHRLRVGVQGIVGYVAAWGEPRIALHVEEDAAFVTNPDLPDTRAEMAVQMRARGEVIGVLDVQSREPEAFSEEDVQLLQALADQVSLAVSSARLFVQLEGRLEAERQVYGELTREAWLALLRTQPDLGFFSDEEETVPAGDLWRPEMRETLRTGEVTSGDGDDPTLAIPITVRNQVVGVIDGRKRDGTPWTEDERELLQALVDQLNVALEGAQLYRDAQRREMRERTVGQVAARMRESLDLESVLQTAADEMRQALGLERVVVRLGMSRDHDRA